MSVLIPVVLRFDRSVQRPILFFLNSNERGYWIECYDRIGQHSEAAKSYLLSCERIRKPDEKALALVREWNGLGGGERARILHRLPYPRHLPYIGK